MAHAKDFSEESTSITLSERILDEEAAREILKRTLSVGTVHSRASSFAERMNAARMRNVGQYDLRDIGRGSCGSVFEIPGTAYAVKKGANTTAIWNDFNLNNHAYNSYLNSRGLLEFAFPGRRVPRVPLAHYFDGPDSDDFWAANISRFPKGDRTRAAIFHIDRILPVLEITRQALIRKFFQEDEKTQRDVLGNSTNKDCLVRVYLGRNSPNTQLYNSTDTLRNFPLYLNEAKMIGLDVNVYAEEMAMGLAFLHWQAEIDAQDTEFVLGSSITEAFAAVYPNHESLQPPKSTIEDFTRRETKLWMLDFDKCSKADLESKGAKAVEKYFVAVTGNDPYFPHPRLDVDLWRKFRATYLTASSVIIHTRRLEFPVARLPGLLIEQWEQWADRDVEAEDFDPFERSSGDGEADIQSEHDGSDQEGDDEEDDDEDDNSEEEEADDDDSP